MIATLLALVLGLCPVGGLGQVDVGEAERAYAEGRYQVAYDLFRAALAESNEPSGQLLYNVGNCAYRLGEHAEALLYFRRARLRLPGDPQVEFNLELARRQLGFAALDPEQSAWSAALGGSVGAGAVAWIDARPPGALLLMVGLLQAGGLAGLVLLGRRSRARRWMLVLVGIGLVLAGRLVNNAWLSGSPEGVVLARQIAVHVEPHAEVAVAVRLRAGETVRIEEMSDRWVRVAHPRGSGWTPRSGLGLVD